jgi:hypothetical protein
MPCLATRIFLSLPRAFAMSRLAHLPFLPSRICHAFLTHLPGLASRI